MKKTTKAQNKRTATKGLQRVVVRAYSGVFYGELVSKTATSLLLRNARHIYQWDSAGLPRKALTTDDLAIIGAGSGTRISGAVPGDSEIADWKHICPATAESSRVIEALPCRA